MLDMRVTQYFSPVACIKLLSSRMVGASGILTSIRRRILLLRSMKRIGPLGLELLISALFPKYLPASLPLDLPWRSTISEKVVWTKVSTYRRLWFKPPPCHSASWAKSKTMPSCLFQSLVACIALVAMSWFLAPRHRDISTRDSCCFASSSNLVHFLTSVHYFEILPPS